MFGPAFLQKRISAAAHGPMHRSSSAWVGGFIAGTVATTLIGATRAPVEPLRPVTVTLHRFDIAPGREAAFGERIAFLHAHHRDSVATLSRERTYFEAMFTATDEPRRLYWIEVQGAGGASVDTSQLEVDRRHIAYMDTVLAKGSHRRLITQNVLAPDFIVGAVRDHQRRVEI